MNKTVLIILGVIFSIHSLLGMEEGLDKKRQKTDEVQSPSALKRHPKSLKNYCLTSVGHTIIQDINPACPSESASTFEELGILLPQELYSELIVHLEKQVQPTWTRGTFILGNPELITNNDHGVVFIDPHFQTDPAKCSYMPFDSDITSAKDFYFESPVELLALAPTTNYIALATQNELLLWNTINNTESLLLAGPVEKSADIVLQENEEFSTIVFSSDGETLFIGTTTGRCIILSNITELLYHNKPEYHHYFDSAITALTGTHDGHYIFATDDKGNMLCTKRKEGYATSYKIPIAIPSNQTIESIFISPDNSIIACNASDEKCYFYNTILNKTVFFPKEFFICDITDDNLVRIRQNAEDDDEDINALLSLAIYFNHPGITEFDGTNFEVKKVTHLPMNTQLCASIGQASLSLLDVGNEGSSCILKPKKSTLDALLIKLAFIKSKDNLKALENLLSNNRTLIKTFQEQLGSSRANLTAKCIKRAIKVLKAPEEQHNTEE